MATRERWTVEARKAQLLALGKDAFARQGFETVTLEDIAEQAGVTRTLVYHYFPTKREFFLATVRATSANLRARTAPDMLLAPAQQLLASLDGFLDYIETHGETFRTLVRSASGIDPEVAEVAGETRALMASRVFDALRVDNPPPAIRLAVRGWVGFVESATLDWIDSPDADRATLRDLFAGSLAAILEVAERLAPGCMSSEALAATREFQS